ncbi:XisI protein [Nodosilinea sp. LEGE 06152]|uniref:XisI protein n=1 Tax=Nodosilinea sp. LEGE 06152 TaxID=2777966 RepID=UPI00187FE536|nr:XisI protein [Nodosilinea sp. LEGE 06152]MBE9155838.1 XisI protein [Nodosilinea sp. LEGE 06152]
METLDQWRTTLEETLQYYAELSCAKGNVETYVMVSRDGNHFLLMHEGWQGNRRIHGIVVHAEIRDGKIWIHYDGIEGSITEELVTAGVPKERIVLAFHPPYVREHTGYAVA